MKTRMLLSVLSLAPSLLLASQLSVYQDKTLYSYTPDDTFIGLTKNVKAQCGRQSVAVQNSIDCPTDQRLCSLYQEAEKLNTHIRANTENSQILDKLVTLPQPDSIDAKSWIAAARSVAKEKAALLTEKEKLAYQNKVLKQRFARETRSTLPLVLEKPCKKALTLTLPYGYITFQPLYEANLPGNGEIEVTQKLTLRNRSGVDIKADKAHFYNTVASQPLYPVHFNPWIVSETKTYMPRKALMMNDAMVQSKAMVKGTPSAAPKANYLQSREYAVTDLVLPSTGEPKEVPVMTWKVPVNCGLESYPYRRHGVFEVCRFTPKFQIEQHRWKYSEKGKLANEKAVGEYDGNFYTLYTKLDQDIKIVRKPIVRHEKESGIFGSTVRKKDGFRLEITNKSNRVKKLRIIERIPVSTTEKINVKLLTVKGAKYTLKKEGKIIMPLILQPHEHKEIEVLFELSYDKDLKVSY